MTDNTYQPAKVWTWDKSAAARSPISIARFLVRRMKKRARWQTPLATLFAGNAERSERTIMLEELLELGVTGAEYDAC